MVVEKVVDNPQRIGQVRQLFQEYADELGIDLCFQGFPEELAGLPGKYAPPKGALLIARENENPLGCVALRPLKEDICEMKRLFVRPQARRSGLGRELAVRIIQIGSELGYQKMRLDTLDILVPALKLYKELGFYEIEAYYPNPEPNVVYLECNLADRSV